MVAPTVGYTPIPAATVASGKPLLTTTGVQLIDNDEHLKQVLYGSYTAAQEHDHDGANSAIVRTLGSFGFTDATDVNINVSTGAGGTVWGAAQSIEIPTTGMILFTDWLRIDNTANGAGRNFSLGLKIGAASHFPALATINIAAFSAQNISYLLDPTLPAVPVAVLDIAEAGIATGAQNVQPVIGTNNTAGAQVLKGTVRTSRCQMLVLSSA